MAEANKIDYVIEKYVIHLVYSLGLTYIWLQLSSFAHYKLDEVVTKGVEGLYNIQFIRLF